MRLLNLARRMDAIVRQSPVAPRSDRVDRPLVAEEALAGEAPEEDGKRRDADPLLAWPVLYVSPCARHFGVHQDEASILARDISQVDADDVGRAYRRLDAEWFAWLAHRTARARRMARDGELYDSQAAQVAQVLARLRAVRTWALRHLDRQELAEAVDRGIARNYRPPRLRLVHWRDGK